MQHIIVVCLSSVDVTTEFMKRRGTWNKSLFFFSITFLYVWRGINQIKTQRMGNSVGNLFVNNAHKKPLQQENFSLLCWPIFRNHNIVYGVRDLFPFLYTQYAHNVVLTSIRRRFSVMDVVWTSKRRRVLIGYSQWHI